MLGIDVRYRGGFSIHDPLEPVADAPERHQWLELSLRPTMRTFACDLYLQDGHKDRPPSLLTWPIAEAYLQGMYPNGALKVFGGHPVKTAPLNDTDVCPSLHPS